MRENRYNGVRKIMALFVLILLLAESLPVTKSHAAGLGRYEYRIGGNMYYTGFLIEAFQKCYYSGGGIIWIKDNTEINIPNSQEFAQVKSDTMIVIEKNAKVTIGKYGLQLDGMMINNGVLDLKNSKGILWGEGTVFSDNAVKYSKCPYKIEREGEVCFTAGEISCGQSLAEADIRPEQIEWKCPVEGEWSFVDGDCIPPEGSHLYDIVFVPKNSMMYDTQVFEKAGRVNVKTNENPILADDNTYEAGIVSVPEPVIITKMVSKPSTICSAGKKAVSKCSRIKTIRRTGSKAKLTCSKVVNRYYEVQYGTHTKMKKAKKKISSRPVFSINKLKKGKRYYFRVRTFQKKNKKKTYSKWSAVCRA